VRAVTADGLTHAAIRARAVRLIVANILASPDQLRPPSHGLAQVECWPVQPAQEPEGSLLSFTPMALILRAGAATDPECAGFGGPELKLKFKITSWRAAPAGRPRVAEMDGRLMGDRRIGVLHGQDRTASDHGATDAAAYLRAATLRPIETPRARRFRRAALDDIRANMCPSGRNVWPG
jgi:hypothetical protein